MNSIIWSPEADDDFSGILTYLSENWQNKVVLNFIDDLNNVITQIQNNPFQFPLFSNSLKVHRCVVSKHNSIFYMKEHQIIYILRIFDTRQNPDNFRYELTF